MKIGIDAGGTFTDFVMLRSDMTLRSFKLRSNAASPAQVILEGIRQCMDEADPHLEIVHGSTVATNALLERKGAKTAFVATEGFEDILRIGRQNRRELYNLTPSPVEPLIRPELCFGIRERSYFDGTIAVAPSAAALKALAIKLRRAGVESVAVCLLHSYENPQNEREVQQALDGSVYLSCSHEISPEIREYERASTTSINAYVGPLMDSYLSELERNCPYPVAVMQSNGGFLTAAEARKQAVRTILSGPAGGIVGAAAMAELSGFSRSLTFDMGGTSTDVSLCQESKTLTTEARVDGLPVRVPMLDIHTVGAGGGSIARVDAGGALRVGPESAGASPGPACYGSGTEATVTDAHVVLGRIDADQFLGGAMRLDVERASDAVRRLATKMGVGMETAAAGIIRVANANMERAMRVVSVERGLDPRQYPLVAFGGCGGLHACEIAEELGVATVMVPALAGALSALGMLLADRVRDYSMGALRCQNLNARFRKLAARAKKDIPDAHIELSADIRYRGQSYELTVPWHPADPAAPFHVQHQQVYGYANPDRATEVVTIRVRAVVPTPRPKFETPSDSAPAPNAKKRRVYLADRWRSIPVVQREHAALGLAGPALLLDYGSTTLIPNGWTALLGPFGNLVAKRTVK